MKKGRVVIGIFICLFLMSCVSCFGTVSAITNFGSFKQSHDIFLLQTCDNGKIMCDACTISSVKDPNSTLLVSDKSMTKRTSDFNYTLTSQYTENLGTYHVAGFCTSGARRSEWVYTFVVSPSGQEMTTGISLQYILFMGISIALFLFLLAGAILIKGGNARSNEGFLTSINYKKYAKIACGFGAYIMLVLIFYFAYQISYSLANLTFVYSLTRAAFIVLAWLLLPITIVTLIMSIVSLVKDANFSDILSRGGRVR